MNENLAFSLYVLNCAVTVYGTVLFVWWWKHSNWKASAVYVYITILFCGQAVRNIIEAYTFYWRAIMGANEATLDAMIYDQWWWPLRLLVPFVIVCCIVGHLTYRAISSGRGHGD